MTDEMPIDTPHVVIAAAAMAGETGEWRERSDGWVFTTGEPYTNVFVYRSGAIHVNGRLADKVRQFPGSKPHDHIGYVGLKWLVR